ncbi:MAG TPA: hypothetical protein VK605_10045, partial [Solirubrobacteraceae bacterium]|nr:hypothetical protein [Solirubrobacteraceae bacterium]
PAGEPGDVAATALSSPLDAEAVEAVETPEARAAPGDDAAAATPKGSGEDEAAQSTEQAQPGPESGDTADASADTAVS